ncbi:BioY protein [Acidimicrobium ferrooxidans DSM 10331]|uniref:Biotin transporter n=1 Tax=Acidimicrobium ferrooxidans (strain DSM 10331 / JCM 15462 / NBRC 103882 / ICP) TaxID=525909 RepID=C7M2F5_ACIFD|nr:biotin transporter BioY [Acidimicrobium ferrooxidans]ACU53199.1 BioY protein [Acidimicrobium ferrooxidans DSM 10331]
MLSERVVRARTLGDVVAPGALARVVAVVGYAAFIGVLAQVAIPLPFTPVPITGQTFAVLLGALALGPGLALAGTALYAAVGLAGVPWFAGATGGLHMVSDPSFGYIVGFMVAAAFVGWLGTRGADRRPLTTIVAMVVGNLAIYAVGVAWLAVALGVSLPRALELGMVPFVVGDLVKVLLAAGLLPGAWFALRRLGARGVEGSRP